MHCKNVRPALFTIGNQLKTFCWSRFDWTVKNLCLSRVVWVVDCIGVQIRGPHKE